MVTNSSNSMAPLLSASTCHVGDYGKGDEEEELEEEEEEEKEEKGEKEEEEEEEEKGEKRRRKRKKRKSSTSSTISFNSLSDILSPILRSTVPSSCLSIIFILFCFLIYCLKINLL